MRVLIASDSGGVAYPWLDTLKAELVEHLQERGLEVTDFGSNAEESLNYPEFAHKVCGTFTGVREPAILISGSGVGLSIAANRHRDIRCALCVTPEMAYCSRRSNDANVLALGAQFIDEVAAISIVNTFLDTSYEQITPSCP